MDNILTIDELRLAMLICCRDKFAEYARNHRAKAERATDFAAKQEAIAKAERNEALVRDIEALLD